MSSEQRLSLLAVLKEGRYDAAVFGTFNLSFPFYEDVVLRTLQSRGCQHQLVLMDAKQCAREMNDAELAPRFAGRQYGLVPVRMDGAFHPKFALLLGRQRYRMVVGSHNLTVAGFGGNLEVTNVLDPTTGESERRAARGVFEFARAWVQHSNPEMLELLDACTTWAPWLQTKPSTSSAASDVLLSATPRGPSLWDQLTPHIHSRVEHVVVLGPYFDGKLSFLKRLYKDLTPQALWVGVHPNSSEIPANAEQLCPDAHFVDLSSWADNRLVHAKVLWLQLANGESILASGSANPSAPAWLAGDARRNAELVMVRRLPKGSDLAKRLGLNEIKTLPNVPRSVWTAIAQRQVPALDEPAGHPVYVALATARGLEAPTAFLADVKSVELADVAGERTQITLPHDWARAGYVSVDEDTLAQASTAHAKVRGLERIALIQHMDQLRDQAVDENRRTLRSALLELGTADSGFEALIQAVERAIFDSSAPMVRPRGSPRESTPPDSESPTIGIGTLERKKKGRPRIAEGDLGLILDLLIRKLGEGIAPSADAAARLSDEHITATSEPPPPPQDIAQGAQLAAACQRKTKRLIERMEKRLTQDGDGEHATRVVVQLCATLALLQRLRARERDLLWLPRGETLVALEHRWSLFKTATNALHRPAGGLAALAVAERGSTFLELEECNALLLHCAFDCELDTRTAIPKLEFGEEADDEEIAENLIGLTLLTQCLLQPVPPIAQLSLLFGPAGLLWLDRHLAWATDAATCPGKTLAFTRGTVVRCRTKQYEFLSVVLECDGKRLTIVDPNKQSTLKYLDQHAVAVDQVGVATWSKPAGRSIV